MLTIISDVDGVLANLVTPWLAKYNKDYDDDVKPENLKDWDIHPFLKPECGLKFYDYIEDPKLYDKVKPYTDDAQQTIAKLREDGHRVIFVTTSTLGASGAKFTWLTKWGFIDGNGMGDYVEATDKNLIKADVLIDDRYDNTQKWYNKGQFPILFKQPWNENKTVPYYHTSNWDNVYKIIQSISTYSEE